MSVNIEMNVMKDDGNYETLYPKTDYELLLNKPDIPNIELPLSVANGGTGTTSLSSLGSSLSSYGQCKIVRTTFTPTLGSDIYVYFSGVSGYKIHAFMTGLLNAESNTDYYFVGPAVYPSNVCFTSRAGFGTSKMFNYVTWSDTSLRFNNNAVSNYFEYQKTFAIIGFFIKD